MQTGAWPYSVCDVGISVVAASFMARGNPAKDLPYRDASDAWVVDAGVLREVPDATVTLSVECTTTAETVAVTVFGDEARAKDIGFGYKILCHDTKHRAFLRGKAGGVTSIHLQLSEIGGTVQIEPLFTLAAGTVRIGGLNLAQGAVLGESSTPMLVQIDRQFYGDHLSVVWQDFPGHGLPKDALVHVQLVGDSPEVWLNERFKQPLAMLDAKGRDLESIAGDALRRMIHAMVWERVLLWAVEHEDPGNDKLPATRIAATWRRRFTANKFAFPERGTVDADDLNALSVYIQHCIETGPSVARIEGIMQFKTV